MDLGVFDTSVWMWFFAKLSCDWWACRFLAKVIIWVTCFGFEMLASASLCVLLLDALLWAIDDRYKFQLYRLLLGLCHSTGVANKLWMNQMVHTLYMILFKPQNRYKPLLICTIQYIAVSQCISKAIINNNCIGTQTHYIISQLMHMCACSVSKLLLWLDWLHLTLLVSSTCYKHALHTVLLLSSGRCWVGRSLCYKPMAREKRTISAFCTPLLRVRSMVHVCRSPMVIFEQPLSIVLCCGLLKRLTGWCHSLHMHSAARAIASGPAGPILAGSLFRKY